MVELLAPAGSMEALQAAIHAGADAIYVGGSRFNARAFATNFDNEALKVAVKLCHLHGVRLFVTVNTIYKEDEIEALYDYLKELYLMQVDALIVQDEGLMHLIQDHFKDFEIHASTQCSIHNPEGISHFEKMGLKRVVVARENSIEEIKAMKASTNCEIEAFVHGALCVSYSGQCFMSQMIGKRSANRGQCAQPCRLPYTLYKDNKLIQENSFLMSCKDLCTIEHIDELIDAGISSFKIEGRMKRPEYVYAIVHSYREAIDHHSPSLSNDDLKQLFNRDFTSGYLFNENQIVSPEYSGNRGLVLGEVIGYNNKFKRLKIRSTIPVTQGDGIRIGYSEDGKVLNKIYLDGKLVHDVLANTVFETDYPSFVKNGTFIYRTTSIELEKEIDSHIHQLYRKIAVNMHLKGKVGQGLVLEMHDGTHQVIVSSDTPIEKAQKPCDFERLEAQLRKLGQTIYEANTVTFEMSEDCFIPIKVLNELRRMASEKMDDLRSNKRVREVEHVKPLSIALPKQKQIASTYLHFHSFKQLQAALPYIKNATCYFDLNDEFESAKALYQNLGLVVPTIATNNIFDEVDAICQKYPDISLAVNNIGAYERYKDQVTLLLPGFNLSHQISLDSYDLPCVVSLDLSNDEIKVLENKGCQFVSQVYGHLDNMTTKYCPVSFQKFGKKIEKCQICKKGMYHVCDRAGAAFNLLFENNCIVHLLSEKPIQRKKAKYSYYRFTYEKENEVIDILKQ